MIPVEVFEQLLPEVAALRGVKQNPDYHPEGDAFEHTILVLNALRDRTEPLIMAALLHDTGKAETTKLSENGNWHSPGHAKVSVRITRKVMGRMKFEKRHIESAAWMVENHMKIHDFESLRRSKQLRLINHPDFLGLLELHRADLEGRGNGDTSHADEVSAIARVLREEVPEPKPVVTGNDLLAMGFKAGPEFGPALSEANDAFFDGVIKTVGEAREMAKNLMVRATT